MNRLTVRIWITAALMAFGWLGTAWVRAGYTFDVHPLGRSLDALPIELESCQGKDIPIDEEVRKILNADALVNRFYQGLSGDSFTVHVSAWFRPESMSSVAPHRPIVCYTNAGWKLLQDRHTTVKTPKGELPLYLLLFEREGERCIVTYWYQMGHSTFNSAGEARKLHRQYWGQKQWPPTVKVLIQTSDQDIDTALPRIEHLASTVFQWTIDL